MHHIRGIKFTKLLFLFIWLKPTVSLGLVPLKNILLGEVNKETRASNGPFQTIDRYNELLDSKRGDSSRAFRFYQRATNLKNYCEAGGRISYLDEASRRRGLKSFMASLRFFGLSKVASNIGSLVNKLEFDNQKKINLSENLVDKYCSNNLTVISKVQLKKYLKELFFKTDMVNNMEKSPGDNLFSQYIIYENNLKRSIRNFRNFCSWTGSVDHLGLMERYFYSPLFVQRGIDYFFDSNISHHNKIVACENNICRKIGDTLGAGFQRSISARSIESDFKESYCKYFNDESLIGKKNNEAIREWKKSDSLHDTKLDLLYFLKITGLGDNLLNNVRDEVSFKQVFESHLDLYFETWASAQLESSDNDFVFEEKVSLKRINSKKGIISLDVNVGPIDDVFEGYGRLSLSVPLGIRKSFIAWWRREYLDTSPKNIKKIKHLRKTLALEIRYKLKNNKGSLPLGSEILPEIEEIVINYFFNSLPKIESLPKGELNIYTLKLNYSAFALKKIYEKQKVIDLTVKEK